MMPCLLVFIHQGTNKLPFQSKDFELYRGRMIQFVCNSGFVSERIWVAGQINVFRLPGSRCSGYGSTGRELNAVNPEGETLIICIGMDFDIIYRIKAH